ncbi:uncharacterized protein EV420DRAFT_1672943 [Desarmillaria tabescens]|uniref:Uncharacterized protein n=1 Tax=Armillaria tabescens TaxID=1929756 RepID=A0AA39N796_ARMTA|nr:uncharacterized protein EV420DRAFT_1672943 [Desarmillaria tabescens]KAK0460040.1 hypothetical protein EV420DRAFT_1672943 [Desarmillaria tabescens]
MSTIGPTSKAMHPQTGSFKLEHYYLPGYATRSLTTTVSASISLSGSDATNINSSWETPHPELEAATCARTIRTPTHHNSAILNPAATPFVPIDSPLQPKPQTRASKINESTLRAKPNSRDSKEPKWNSAFISGCLEDPKAKWNFVARRASQIVCSPWFSVEKDLGILIRKFCQRARVQEMGGGPESLAPFAAEVHRTIHVFFGAHAALLFRKKLATLAVRTFIDKWDIKIPKAIGLFPRHVPLLVMTTMSLLDFIGELHVHGILEGHQLFACLQVLLKGLKTVEHIQAIHRLMVRSKGGCWRPDGEEKHSREVLETILQKFLDASIKVTNDIKLLTGTSYSPSVMEGWVNEIEQFVSGLLSAAV